MRTMAMVLAVGLLGALGARGGEEFSPVRVTLRPHAAVAAENITVGDVADISGGSAVLRERIRNVELGEAPRGREAVPISRSQVDFRLKLTDLPLRSFAVAGASECGVSLRAETLSEERVLEVAREKLVKSLGYPEEDLSVRLARPFTVQLPQTLGREKVVIKAQLHAHTQDLGRAQVDVAILIDGEKKLQFPVYFEAKLLRLVPVALKPLAKGDVLAESHVKLEKRPVEATLKTLSTTEALLGKRMQRPVAAGQVVALNDLEAELAPTGAQGGNAGVLVRARQAVKMIVPVGAVNVVARGEALQDGKMGQTIRVQNVDSKKVITGRVTGPDTIEVNPGVSP